MRLPPIPLRILALALAIAAAAPLPAADQAPAGSATAAAAAADAELAAAIATARATYPAAKKRFADGLPRGEQFVVLVEMGEGGQAAYVPVRVRTIIGTTIKGKVWAKTDLPGVAFGQDHDVEEAAILDWRIVKADGGVDGDVVGRLLAAREAKAAPGQR